MKDELEVPQWLLWAREIQALAQTSTEFATNEFQVHRYLRLTEIAAEIVAEHSNLPAKETAAHFWDEFGYATPRVDVRACVFNEEGKLLIVQDWRDKTWSMPGGWADVGDVPSVAAERETEEESGYLVKAKKVIGVYDANRVPGKLDLFHAFKIVFACELLGGEARLSDETIAIRWVGADEFPPELSNRTTVRHLEDALAHYANPDLPASFD